MKSHLLIGAASSGSGKTTFTLGLLRALKNRSLKVRPFKCGPDYIDTRHHTMAADCPSINLDGYMMSDTHLKELYSHYAQDAEVAVTEGVMGLFDGYDSMKGSSAEIAAKLTIPVILIVNAKSTAYSVAPLLYGFKHFNQNINLVGAVFNFVASENHYSFLKQACEDAGVEALGYLPKQAEVAIPSRHLGLSLDDDFCFESFADRVASLVEQHVDIDRILSLTASNGQPLPDLMGINNYNPSGRSLKIAVAHDAAFNFVYEENLQVLNRIGCVSFFSPLKDAALPDADFVYLPGGYPELYLSELSTNRAMIQSVFHYIEAGGKLLAECGGMMYLCKEIRSEDGRGFPMVGILPQSATMEQMKLRLGYRSLHYGEYRMKGHEFHYSRIIAPDVPVASVAKAYAAKGGSVDTPLYQYKNMLAGYTHLYWGDRSENQWFTDYLYASVPFISK